MGKHCNIYQIQKGKRYVARFISTTSWDLLQGLHFFAGLLKEVKADPSRNDLILFPLNLNWWDSWKTKLTVFDRHQSLKVFKYFYVPFRALPFDFWRGYDDFRKKNVLQTYFRGKKFLQGNTCEENSYNEKKYLSRRVNLEKKSYTVVCQEKILSPDFGEIFFLPKPNHPYPHPLPSKVKWLAP